jgi:hypothetical protein
MQHLSQNILTGMIINVNANIRQAELLTLHILHNNVELNPVFQSLMVVLLMQLGSETQQESSERPRMGKDLHRQ